VTIDGSPAVEERDARSGRLVAVRRPGGMPHDIAFRPRGDEVWLSNWRSGTLTVASSRSGRALARIAAGAEPHHFAFGLGAVWASDNGGGSLVRIEPATRRVLRRASVGPAPHHVAVAGRHVLVAINGTGRLAVVSWRGRVIRSVAVGGGPHGIAALRAPGRRTSQPRGWARSRPGRACSPTISGRLPTAGLKISRRDGRTLMDLEDVRMRDEAALRPAGS
jgi:DNA-binding beta-propeller fold protein YncE